jgi:hypothetical protein
MDLCLDEGEWISTIYFMMDEENVRLQLQQPWIKISTDAGGFDPAWAAALGPYHPRAYGSYPRVLGKYVRSEQILPIEDAIRKMSGAVAARLGLHDRGLLRAGCMADVIIFDPDTIDDQATYQEPHRLATGVQYVWVNGVCVLRNGAHTGATPGHIVDGPGRALAEQRRQEAKAAARAAEKAAARALKAEAKADKALRKQAERIQKMEAKALKVERKAARAANKAAARAAPPSAQNRTDNDQSGAQSDTSANDQEPS